MQCGIYEWYLCSINSTRLNRNECYTDNSLMILHPAQLKTSFIKCCASQRLPLAENRCFALGNEMVKVSSLWQTNETLTTGYPTSIKMHLSLSLSFPTSLSFSDAIMFKCIVSSSPFCIFFVSFLMPSYQDLSLPESVSFSYLSISFLTQHYL